ncbi:hypothetical protein [Nonomuraea wenchangensis]|uniref:hypothetical protein n=1 Tax=Nonomuraea wenchangensis TaxID=568860 RepID=UPI0033294E3C
MPPRLPDAKRAAILDDIRAGKPRNQIAREHEVSPSTVSKIAEENGVTNAFDRAQTENATKAALADNKARRVLLSSQALDDAGVMRLKALESDSGRDARDFATAYGIFIDKHAVLERLDSDGGADSAKGMIGALAAGLQAAYEQLPPDDQP